MKADFNNYRIGRDQELLQLESWDENRTVATIMVQQASRSLNIISRLLDPAIFNSAEFISAVRGMVTGNRFPKIRIIVFDPDTIVRNGHQLVELAGHLSSFIEIRKATREFSNYNECLLMVDDTAFLHRLNGERFEATANFNDPRQCYYYKQEFETMWEAAKPDPNLRKMRI
jgi:hypothetical protein